MVLRINNLIVAAGFNVLLSAAGWAQEQRDHEMHMSGMAEHHTEVPAPIGVMGGHTHHAGKWMTTYRYMYMNMDGNRDGNDRVSTSDVRRDFVISPIKMTMQMHMLGIMYAPANDLTIMSMIPYVLKEMDHVTRIGAEFTTRTDGIGDIKLTALYNF